ncbi:hypothetical protein CSA57_12555 [candidate division KSB3 bacterium]|nr:MAG: hypothetical protein CSA57_12555 [candidate division KSB3 bacterium]
MTCQSVSSIISLTPSFIDAQTALIHHQRALFLSHDKNEIFLDTFSAKRSEFFLSIIQQYVFNPDALTKENMLL